LALAIWLIPCLIISIRVIARPYKRTVTPLYHGSVERWQARQPLYDGPAGMNYLPTFVPLFAPYHLLPVRAADLLWRWTAMGGLAAALWGFARHWGGQQGPGSEGRTFTLLSLLGLPLCLGALSNGQANAHLGAALLLASLCLLQARLWPAAVCLALAVAVKPLGVAALGLAVLCYPRLWWRAGVAVVAIFALPFFLAPWPYALNQFGAALENLRQCAEVTEHRFADLNGLLRTVGLPLGAQASLLVRAGAGLLWAAVCLGWVRRFQEPDRSLAWYALAGAYLMLFNPMTESNSYVVFGPALALWAWHWHLCGKQNLARLIVVGVLSMGLLPTLLRPWLGSSFALAWHPAVVILFLLVFAIQMRWRRPFVLGTKPVAPVLP
jgi:hypothetical protein